MKILFETGNSGKLREVRTKFAPLGIEVQQLDDEYPEIQTDSLEDVVRSGLKWLWERHEKPIIIDDSGLFIEALGGFPGVYSAYVFKTLGIDGVLKQMDGLEDRRAEFRCCAGYVDACGRVITRIGKCPGKIMHKKLGSDGFGYDPIFMPDGYSQTFAELDMESKNQISHRGRAFDALASEIESGISRE